jgi:hypothetical protein
VVLALALGAPLGAREARGQPPGESLDEEQADKARTLADDGRALFEAGDYEGALAKFDAALAIVRRTKFALYAARCAERLGRLVEASERYLVAIRIPIPQESSEVNVEARSRAESERAELLARIPRLTISVTGARGALRVSVDGKSVPAGREQGWLVDPGTHRVVVASGTQRRVENVGVKEGDVREISVRFEAPAPVPRATPGARPRAEDGDVEALPILGWTAASLGGAALIAGAVTGGLLLGKKNDLEAGCGGALESCDVSVADDDMSDYNALRVPTTALLVSGGMALAVGVTVLLVDAADTSETALQLSPDGVTLGGRF